MYVRLLKDQHYPAAWVLNYPPLKAGTVVPVVEATNMPQDGSGMAIRLWVNTPALKDDAYGIGLGDGDYEVVQPVEWYTIVPSSEERDRLDDPWVVVRSATQVGLQHSSRRVRSNRQESRDLAEAALQRKARKLGLHRVDCNLYIKAGGVK